MGKFRLYSFIVRYSTWITSTDIDRIFCLSGDCQKEYYEKSMRVYSSI